MIIDGQRPGHDWAWPNLHAGPGRAHPLAGPMVQARLNKTWAVPSWLEEQKPIVFLEKVYFASLTFGPSRNGCNKSILHHSSLWVIPLYGWNKSSLAPLAIWLPNLWTVPRQSPRHGPTVVLCCA